MKKLYLKFFLLLSIFTFVSIWAHVVSASDITSASFIIRDPVIGVGSGYGSSATFQVFGSQDPEVIGVGSSASFLSRYGFLYFDSSVTPTPTPTPSPTPSSGSGGGGRGVSAAYPDGCRVADYNCDGKVNIMDLSILLYYSDHPGSTASRLDLTGDGILDLRDISIMFYYWDA